MSKSNKFNNRLQNFYDNHQNRARLLISCPDQPGLVASLSSFLADRGANIVQSHQYTTDPEGGLFFMRIEFDIPNLQGNEQKLEEEFAPVAEEFQMEWQMIYAYKPKKMAIFVSKMDHCLVELLWQWQAGDLLTDIAMVISNHDDLRSSVEAIGLPYYHIPVTKDTKEQAEQQQLDLLREHEIDVIVLARYMQILSPDFVQHYPNQIINIHHSFLPAFVGARPYERAYERGVKLIGATSHYVTNDLDEGPIIEQDIQRVSHTHQADDLKRKGRHVERRVLARAVAWHLEDRIIVHGNKTVVFN